VHSGRRPVAFVFDGRLDQSLDQGIGAEPGTLSELINLRLNKRGELEKRSGYPSLNTSLLGEPVRLLPHGDAVAYADANALLQSYGEGTNKLSTRDRTQQWALTGARLIAKPPYFFPSGGCCSAGGATFHVYVDGNDNTVKAVVVDEVSGKVLRGTDTVYAINAGLGETGIPLARVVTDGTRLWVFFQVTAATTALAVVATTVSNILANGSWPAKVGLGTIDPVNPSFDIHVTTNFAYAALNNDTAGTKKLKVIRVDSAGAITHTYTFNVACRAVSCLFDGTQLWVLYVAIANPTSTELRVFDATLNLLANNGGLGCSANVNTTGIGLFDSNSVVIVAGTESANYNPRGHIAWGRADYAAGVISFVSLNLFAYGCYPASQPFRTGTGNDGSDVFMWVECAVDVFDPHASTCLIALTHDGGSIYDPGAPTGLFPHLRIQAGHVTGPPFTYGVFTGYVVPQKVYVSSQDANTYVWDGEFFERPETRGVKEYRFQCARPFINAALAPMEAHGLTLTTGGAQCFAFDGAYLTELGFANPPQSFTDYVVLAGSGGLITAGAHQWAVTYEYQDAQGLRHQSAPWFSGLQTAAANDKATLTVPALRMTTKQDREFSDGALRIVVWRTTVTDPTAFYRVTSAKNDSQVNTVTVLDTASDTLISANEQLYVSRGELTNECPPVMWHAVQFSGKVAFIDAEYRTRIGFSKPLSADRGPEFSSASQTFVEGIGDLTALAEMDGNLYAFSASGIAWVASGSGIDAAGQGSWPEPQILSRACGCIDPRALCVSQDGVVFVSRQGDAVKRSPGTLRVWLLPRGGGNPVEIGAKARGYLQSSSFQVDNGVGAELHVTSCVNDVDGGRVFIMLYAADTSDGYWLEYDYVSRGQDGLGSWNAGTFASNYPAASSAAVRGRHWMGISVSGGALVRSSDTVFSDVGGEWNSYMLRTHDIKGTAIPRMKLNTITLSFFIGAANNGLLVELSDDQWLTVAANATFPFAAGLGSVKRQWQPAVRRSTTGNGYSLQISSVEPDEGGVTDSADVIPRAVELDIVPLKGTFTPQASERI
jgi:hypothetical protein